MTGTIKLIRILLLMVIQHGGDDDVSCKQLPAGFGSIKSVYLDCQIQIFVKDSRLESCAF